MVRNKGMRLWALALALCVAALVSPAVAKAAPTGGTDGMSYLVRNANGTWAESWSEATPGKDATGVRIRLSAQDDEDYDVWYRARRQDGSWLAWSRDGEELVTPDGSALRDLQFIVTDAGAGVPFDGELEAATSDGGASSLSAQSVTWKRLEGASRYDTMAAIVEEGFSKSDWAVLASGQNFADALAANGLAGTYDCPVILTAGNELSWQALAQIQRLQVKHLFIMGGTSAISTDVENAIKTLNIEVTRVSGGDRSATSAAALVEAHKYRTGSNTVIVASGANYADALSIGPWAYATSSPIVLTKGDGTLSDEAVKAINEDPEIINVLVVGGTSVVSPAIELQLHERSYIYTRLAGTDRYTTSRDIAEWAVKTGLSWNAPAVASGKDFPDALTGGALCGRNKSVLLIASSVKDPTMHTLRANQPSISNGYILGGKKAMPIVDPLMDHEPAIPSLETTAMAQQYWSATDWLIMVDCNRNILAVYHGSQNNWVPYDSWQVTTGAPETPTIKGEFEVGDRGYAFGDSEYTCYWYTQIYGGYLFHSILYNKDDTVRDGRLGLHLSHGCVRNPIERAKWIYDNIPSGTKVVTYPF